MSTSDNRITIEPADNGFIVTVDSADGTKVKVFTRRRQLMHYIGACVDTLLPNDSEDTE